MIESFDNGQKRIYIVISPNHNTWRKLRKKNIEHVQAELCQAQVELGLPAISLSITLKLFLPVERLQNGPKHEVVFLSENVKAVFPLVENNLYINKDIC